MTIDINAIIYTTCGALGSLFLKYIWDKSVQKREKTVEKAKAYDDQELKADVEKIVRGMCATFSGELQKSINDFKAQAESEFKRYSEMY